MITHLAMKHGIGVAWINCHVEGCTHRAKGTTETTAKSSLARHLANKHEIGVTWHSCDLESCNYRGKSAIQLEKHKARKHDISKMKKESDSWRSSYDAMKAKNYQLEKELKSRKDELKEAHLKILKLERKLKKV